MSARRDFWLGQMVTEQQLDGAFDCAENAERAIITDLQLVGAQVNLAVAQHGAGDLTVDVSGSGIGYDKLGQRLAVAGTQVVNVAVDSNSVSTDVSLLGNSKIVSIFLKFKRTLSDPQVDDNSQTVYFVRDEGFDFLVVQSAEAVSPTPPALQADAILLADVTRTFALNQIFTAAISIARREDTFVIAGSPQSLRAGRIKSAFAALLAMYNDHVTGAADDHDAADIAYAGSGVWSDGSPGINAGTVEQAIDSVVNALSSKTAGSAGTRLIGSDSIVGTSFMIGAAELYGQLGQLSLAANHDYGGGGAWADGTTNPAATVEAQLDKIVSDIASTSGSGARKIGAEAIAAQNGVVGTDIAAGRLSNQLIALKAAEFIDAAARTTWLGGRTNPAAHVYDAIDKIITDLASVTTGDAGAERIGAAQVVGSVDTLAAGSVESQIAALLAITASRGILNVANTWSAQNDFNATTNFAAGQVVNMLAAVKITKPVEHGAGVITASSHASIDVTKALWICDAPAAQYDTDVLNSGAANGMLLVVRRPTAGAADLVLHREGAGAAIVTLQTGAVGCAVLIRENGLWKKLFATGNFLDGIDVDT